jgi:hypothetical protein
MKKLFLLSTAFLLGSFAAQAGNFFGPGPFRNGSPLVSGVDGTYQATARAENVTGIFRFAYSGGSQTSTQNQNNWIFFVNGQIFRGNVVANIDGSSIDGILDASTASTTNTDGSITLPYVYINPNNNATGTFEGTLQMKSPSGAFNGQGNLQGLPGATNQIIGIAQLDALELNLFGNTPAGSIYVSTTNIVNAPTQLAPLLFRFRGVRTSILAPQSAPTLSTNTTPRG